MGGILKRLAFLRDAHKIDSITWERRAQKQDKTTTLHILHFIFHMVKQCFMIYHIISVDMSE